MCDRIFPCEIAKRRITRSVCSREPSTTPWLSLDALSDILTKSMLSCLFPRRSEWQIAAGQQFLPKPWKTFSSRDIVLWWPTRIIKNEIFNLPHLLCFRSFWWWNFVLNLVFRNWHEGILLIHHFILPLRGTSQFREENKSEWQFISKNQSVCPLKRIPHILAFIFEI